MKYIFLFLVILLFPLTSFATTYEWTCEPTPQLPGGIFINFYEFGGLGLQLNHDYVNGDLTGQQNFFYNDEAETFDAVLTFQTQLTINNPTPDPLDFQYLNGKTTLSYHVQNFVPVNGPNNNSFDPITGDLRVWYNNADYSLVWNDGTTWALNDSISPAFIINNPSGSGLGLNGYFYQLNDQFLYEGFFGGSVAYDGAVHNPEPSPIFLLSLGLMIFAYFVKCSYIRIK